METIEFEKTANSQTRYKWSDSTNSNFILNATNIEIYSESIKGTEAIIIEHGLKSKQISFTKEQVSTINGEPAPDNTEDIMQMLTDEVFVG